MQAGEVEGAVRTAYASLKSIHSMVETRQYLIPEFQRKYDWNKSESKKSLLFDSLFNQIYIGNIVVGAPSFPISCKEFDDRPYTGAGSRRELEITNYTQEYFERNVHRNHGLILDGQQRVTTIWRVLSGHDELYYNAKLHTTFDEDLPNELSLSDSLYEVSKEGFPEHICIRLSRIFEILQMSRRDQNEAIIADGTALAIYQSCPDDADRILQIHEKLCDSLIRFMEDPTVCLQTKIDSSIGIFVKYFERANSTPFKLNFVDILVAKVYGGGFRLRPKMQEMIDACSGLSYVKDLNEKSDREFTNIVRMVGALSNTELSESSLLNHLTADDFRNHWDNSVTCFVAAVELLKSLQLIRAHNELAYPNMILPVMAFMYQIRHFRVANVVREQADKIKDWFLRSTLTERYSKKAGDMLKRDVRKLRELGSDPAHEMYPRNDPYTLSFSPSRIQSAEQLWNFSSTSGGIPSGIKSIVLDSAGGDYYNVRSGTRLAPENDAHNHHLFPQDFVDNNGDDVQKDLLDSVMNMVMIEKITNIQFSNKPPQEYLEEIQIQNPQLNEILGQLLIPLNLVGYDAMDYFIPFLQERAQLIFPLLEPYLNINHE